MFLADNINKLLYFTIFTIVLLSAPPLLSQEDLKPKTLLHTLNSSIQLSNLFINAVTEDSWGNIWVATPDGLNKTNGMTNTIFRPSSNKANSISHHNVTSLVVDSQGVLWAGTQNGINIYHEQSNTFSQFNLPDNKIKKLHLDNQNQLIVVTDNWRLFIISSDRHNVFEVSTQSLVEQFGKLYFSSFTSSKNGKTYIATNIGILELESSSFQLKHLHKTYNSPIKNSTSLASFDEYSLLVGTTKGLFKISLDNQTITPFFDTILSKLNIRVVRQHKNESLIIGTRRKGVFVIDINTKKWINFVNSDEKFSLLNNQVKNITRTREDLFFIGTTAGLNFFDLNINNGLYNTTSTPNGCIPGNTSYAIIRTEKSKAWYAFYSHGIREINLETMTCSVVKSKDSEQINKILKNIVSMYEDKSEQIWLGGFHQGIVIYNKKDQSFRVFNPQKSNFKNVDKLYMSALENDDEYVWIATRNSGLFSYNAKADQLTHYKPQKASLDFFNVSDIASDSDDKLWLATMGHGLVKFDKLTGEFSKVYSVGGIKVPENLYKLTLDSRVLWIGSEGSGVIRYEIDTGSAQSYTTSNGLSNNVTMEIIPENNKTTWILTDNGINKVNTSKNQITKFFEKDGLQDNAFTPTGFHDKKTSKLWTGGISGFNVFDTKNIGRKTSSRRVQFDKLEINYKTIEPTDDLNILSNHIAFSQNIKLKHDQNVISLSFSSNEFLFPEKIKYQFRLEGYNKEWNSVNANRRLAHYTNLDPGEYTFKVRSSDVEGQFGDTQAQIKIIITPPWWQTIWAYIAYVIAAILSLYLFIGYRTKALQQRAVKLERSVKERTLELSQEKHKVEQLLSRKNEEFANVSHEFRTPLTLILGPVSQMLKTKHDRGDTTRLNIVQRNGYRLLRMVDQLLNMETFRVKAITQKSPQAIGQTVRLLSEAFADLAIEKDIALEIGQLEDASFEFTPDAFEKILLNLLSNAIKYSKPGDKITVSSARTKDNQFKLTVVDTGIGIPEDKLDTIFERFNRVLDENSERVTGAGIGLALVKELVGAHKGTIEIKSALGEGTAITITLPIIGEVTSGSVDEHINDEIVAMELMSLSDKSENQKLNNDNADSQDNSNLPSLLVIEDNQDMCDYIVQSVQKNYRVSTAKNGREGFELALKEVPDLIISDIMMPEMDGYETTAALRMNDVTNHIPVVLLTARGDRESRLKGWYEQADEYLTKPFDVEELQIRLQNLLSIRNILKKRFSESAFEKTTAVPTTSDDDIENTKNEKLQAFVDKLNTVLERVYMDAEITVADITTELAMSERQFFRKMKSVLDMTPIEYLRRYRLEKAKLLLAEGKTANVASFEVGFASHSYFGRCFKAQYGVSPSQFKKSLDG